MKFNADYNYMIDVAIIDYKMGNLFSISQACIKSGLNPIITSNPSEILSSDGIILPGVGAFGQAMTNLLDLNLITPIRKFIESDKPFMGICLGFQLLFDFSDEFGKTKGLEIFRGGIKKIPKTSYDNTKRKVPIIGWNRIYSFNKNSSWDNSYLCNVDNNEFMYFVHSYYVDLVDLNILLSYSEHDHFQYCSSIQSGNIFGSQFHPEKSAQQGLSIYKSYFNRLGGKKYG